MLLLFAALLHPIIYYAEYYGFTHWTKSSENLSVMRKTFVFLLFMTLILPSFGLMSGPDFLKYIITPDANFTVRWNCLFLPDNGAFFVNYVTSSTFVGTAMEILRVSQLCWYVFLICVSRSEFEHSYVKQMSVYDFPFGSNYAWMLAIFAIVNVYSLICPLITPFGLMYFVLKYLADRYNLYFAYAPSRISASIHKAAVSFVLISCCLAQLTLFFFIFIRSGTNEHASGTANIVDCVVEASNGFSKTVMNATPIVKHTLFRQEKQQRNYAHACTRSESPNLPCDRQMLQKQYKLEPGEVPPLGWNESEECAPMQTEPTIDIGDVDAATRTCKETAVGSIPPQKASTSGVYTLEASEYGVFIEETQPLPKDACFSRSTNAPSLQHFMSTRQMGFNGLEQQRPMNSSLEHANWTCSEPSALYSPSEPRYHSRFRPNRREKHISSYVPKELRIQPPPLTATPQDGGPVWPQRKYKFTNDAAFKGGTPYANQLDLFATCPPQIYTLDKNPSSMVQTIADKWMAPRQKKPKYRSSTRRIKELRHHRNRWVLGGRLSTTGKFEPGEFAHTTDDRDTDVEEDIGEEPLLVNYGYGTPDEVEETGTALAVLHSKATGRSSFETFIGFEDSSRYREYMSWCQQTHPSNSQKEGETEYYRQWYQGYRQALEMHLRASAAATVQPQSDSFIGDKSSSSDDSESDVASGQDHRETRIQASCDSASVMSVECAQEAVRNQQQTHLPATLDEHARLEEEVAAQRAFEDYWAYGFRQPLDEGISNDGGVSYEGRPISYVAKRSKRRMQQPVSRPGAGEAVECSTQQAPDGAVATNEGTKLIAETALSGLPRMDCAPEVSTAVLPVVDMFA